MFLSVITLFGLSIATAKAPIFIIPSLSILEGNSLIYASNPTNYREITDSELLKCFIHQESTGDVKAYNPSDIDGRPKYGCLQFDAGTFNDYCVIKYGLANKVWNDIWDCDIQSQCWQRMKDNNLLWHWGSRTKKNCL